MTIDNKAVIPPFEVAKDKASNNIDLIAKRKRGRPPKIQVATQAVPKLAIQKPKTIAKKTLVVKPKPEEIKS